MSDFFVSYAREDKEFALALVAKLTEAHWSVWIDEQDIPPSVPWAKEIQRSIDESMIVIAIESEDWLQSDACHIELQLAEQSRVPVVRITPGGDQLDAQAMQVVRAYRALPAWRAQSLAAAASAAIWDDAARKGSLLSRGRALAGMRRELRQHPTDFSPTATSYIRASSRAAVRRLTAGLVLGLIVPALVIGIVISIGVIQKVNQQAAQNIADSTAIAERAAYSNWNVYAGIERAPSDVTGSFANYRELFVDLTDRTPVDWNSTPVTASGPLTAVPSANGSTASAEGASIVVTDASGAVTRLLAGSPVRALAWSPDSRWIAAATADGGDVISVANGRVIPLRGGIGATSTVAWQGPATVLVGGSQGTGTWTVFDGAQVGDLGGVRYGTTIGHTLFSVDLAGQLTSTNLSTGASTPISAPTVEGARPATMASTTSQVVIAFGASVPFLRVVDISSGSVTDLPMPKCSPIGLSLTPDGSAAYVACSEAATNRTRVDLATGKVTSKPFDQQEAYGVRVLDDRVLWGGVFGGVFQSGLDLSPRGLLTSAAGCGAPIRKFIGASDGSVLFPIGDATGTVACSTRIEISAGAEPQVDHLIFRATDAHAIPDAATSADGSLIAYGMSDGQVRVFTTDQFIPLYFGQVLPDQVRSIAFSPDGTTLTVAGLGGQVVTVKLPYLTAKEAEKGIEEDAFNRGQKAINWHIYQLTTDPSERTAAPTPTP